MRRVRAESMWACKIVAFGIVMVLVMSLPIPVGGRQSDGIDDIFLSSPTILSPALGAVWSGINMIAWNGYKSIEDGWSVYCDADGATPYDYTVASNIFTYTDPYQDNNWTYIWDTTSVSDGYRYIVIREVGPYSIGATPGISGLFQVRNNGNGVPNPPANPSPANGTSNTDNSPILKVSVSDPDGDNMTVQFYNAANNSLIGTVYNVSSGGNATVEWGGLLEYTAYKWYARASDLENTTQSATWTFDTIRPYNRQMIGIPANKWVLLSFPIQISGHPVEIFNDAKYGDGMTTWTIAKTWDNQHKKWLTYRVGATNNTFNYVDNTMGVWLWVTANSGDMSLTTGKTGMPPQGVTVTLYAGWNLVGYPSMTPRLASNTLPFQVCYLSVYKSTSPYVQDYSNFASIILSPGNAYWVFVTADCTWCLAP